MATCSLSSTRSEPSIVIIFAVAMSQCEQDRLGRKLSDLVREVAKVVVPDCKKYLDIVVACEAEDENGEDVDVDVPLISVKFR